MKKLTFILLLLIIITHLLSIEKLEGYKKYKFGMTIEEADALYDFDKPAKPENLKFGASSGIDYMLLYNTKIYNEEAIVMIVFRNKHIDYIQISFLKIKRIDFKQTSTKIAKNLRDLYNIKFNNIKKIGEKSAAYRWEFVKGGILELGISVSKDFGDFVEVENNAIHVFYQNSDHL